MREPEQFVFENFYTTHQNTFTADEFCKIVRKKGVRINKDEATDILVNSEQVFRLVNNKYVTKNAVFNGRYFSFKPTLEEVQKGYIILGHRAMPFVDMRIPPDRITLAKDSEIIEEESCVFSMNLALNVFSLYGDGYSYPIIIGDHSNKKVSLLQAQYDEISQIRLTAWSLQKIAGKQKFSYGDRILCQVIDWTTGVIYVSVLKNKSNDTISEEDMKREEWYASLEKCFIATLEKNGSCVSIEEQLSYLFLEHQEVLCIKNCGSIEEFFKRQSKISIVPFGLESRIWITEKEIPFLGEWANSETAEMLYMQPEIIFSPRILDCYLANYIEEEKKSYKGKTLYDLLKVMYPFESLFSDSERKILVDQIEKKIPFIKMQIQGLEKSQVPAFRHRVLDFHKKSSRLLYEISRSGLTVGDFPAQELATLVQLFYNSCKIIEGLDSELSQLQEFFMTLEGMESTYYDIKGVLKHIVDKNAYKDITIVN